jgi:hypothetical protein
MADVAIPLTGNPAADFAAAVPADIFDDAPSGGDTIDISAEEAVDAASDAGDQVETIDSPDVLPEEQSEPAPEPEQPTEEAAPDAETPPVEPAPAPADELPDGVRRGKDSSGKEGLFVTPQRWETIYGDHKAVREMSEAIGEPLTLDALQAREAAFVNGASLYSDLFSGDPTLQRDVIDHFFSESQRRRDSGEAASDPMVPFTSTLYGALKERNGTAQGGDPAYAELRMSAARDLVDELFHETAKAGDKDAFRSMQHVVRVLTKSGAAEAKAVREIAERSRIPFYMESEMNGLSRGDAPETLLRKQVEQLQAQLNGRSANTQAAQFEERRIANQQEVRTAVLTKGIKEALTEDSQKGAWKNDQKGFARLVEEPLHRAVLDKLKSDPVLSDKVTRLEAEARRSASAQARDAKLQQIVAAFAIRSRQIAEGLKRGILSDAAQTLAGQSASRNQRLAAAQTQRGPKGTSGSVPRSITPKEVVNPGGFFNAKTEMERVSRLISS